MPRQNQKHGEDHPNWQGELVTPDGGRQRARKIFKIDKCERCGKKASDRHHRDGNTANNKRSNVFFLCRRCHMLEDGRLERLKKQAEINHANNVKSATPCVNCKKPSKPLRRGLCHACNEYLRRHGKQRPYVDKSYNQVVAEKNAIPCKRCGRPANHMGYPRKGYCISCYSYVWQHRNDE